MSKRDYLKVSRADVETAGEAAGTVNNFYVERDSEGEKKNQNISSSHSTPSTSDPSIPEHMMITCAYAILDE